MDKYIEKMNELIASSEKNMLPRFGGIKIYEQLLVAVAAADDPLFIKLKEPDVVGPEHLLPEDFVPGAKSVVSYFLPFSKEIREANRTPGLPAEEWLYGRIEGEEFNDALRVFLAGLLVKGGGRAVAPVLDEKFTKYEVKSNWSERHVAYIAGLGTFGLHRSFITAKGSAGRFGSVVTDLELRPTVRKCQDIYENCTWFRGGKCGACISRCPSGAITEQGKDKRTCRQHVHEKIALMFAPRYGCGKCQTNVPCENSIPIQGDPIF